MKTEREPGILADRYALQALLDRTSIGMVWLATDRLLDRSVTVTIIDPRIACDDASRERLFKNARALATATPGILVRLLDAGMDADVPFLVTERVPGDTLADVLEGDGPLPPARAMAVVAAVLDGVCEATAAGVQRPELRPSTIVLGDEGRVRIRDTGVARAVAESDETPAADDVTAAGALLFELVTGRRPGTDEDIHRIDAPRRVRDILGRSLGDDSRRFHDGASMAAALRASASDDAGAAPGRPRMFRTWFAVPLVVALVAAAVLAAGVWLGRLEIGGPVGIRIHEPRADRTSASEPLDVSDVTVIDPPPGDGIENDDALRYAIDGDPSTVWRSENYFDGTLNKAGVGLVLDLGGERTVTGFRLSTPPPGGFRFSILVGDDPVTLVENALSARTYAAPDVERDLDPQTGRYAVVWITSVVPLADGSNRAEISDVRILGTS
jgi:hypothetical protein